MGGLVSKPKIPKPEPVVVAPPPPPPPVAEPIAAPVAPTEDPDALAKARKKQAAAAQSRSGRASTILSDSSDKLGG